MTPELQIKISQWRQKAIAGTLTLEDMIESLKALREGRRTAAAASAGATTKRKAAATPLPSADDMLNEMMK